MTNWFSGFLQIGFPGFGLFNTVPDGESFNELHISMKI